MASPVVSTWCKAIDADYFQGCPSLTSKRVREHIKVVDQTEMGHMDQRRTGIRSMRPKPKHPPRPTPDQEMVDTIEFPPQSPNNDRCHQVFMNAAAVDDKLYSNQTGRFPITSNRGNILVDIFYAVDGNYIKSYPLKSRDRSQLLKAYEGVYAYLCMRGYIPKLHKIDNETSRDVKEFISK